MGRGRGHRRRRKRGFGGGEGGAREAEDTLFQKVYFCPKNISERAKRANTRKTFKGARKLLKMLHLNLEFSINFCPIKSYLSGNTV